jgi:hypothetical protein
MVGCNAGAFIFKPGMNDGDDDETNSHDQIDDKATAHDKTIGDKNQILRDFPRDDMEKKTERTQNGEAEEGSEAAKHPRKETRGKTVKRTKPQGNRPRGKKQRRP